ncbi:hypothetical protein [Edaphovirga cremea]|uniref:hypothetical protein n=1 Tax=Edaphovirga cremea TaxID=2267246 RepID=UPI000DEEF6EC|nr:hypothetical protein [Edaphovirga cremea]
MKITVPDLLIFAISGVMIISFIGLVTLSSLNKKRFLEVCQLYKLRFGSLPLAAELLKEAGIIGFTSGYSTKIDFIINPLIYGKKSIHSKYDDVEFMRNLPVNLRRWFIAEFLCSLFGFVALIVGGICLLLE